MNYIYVCHFSGGHIKVGRSVEPIARIAAHEARVSCLGVELIAHAIFGAENHIVAEAQLIERCANECLQRHNNEWFTGLSFEVVCGWAAQFSVNAKPRRTGNHIRRIRTQLGVTQAALAEAIGCTQGNISNYEGGQTLPPAMAQHVIEFAAHRGVELRLDDLYEAADAPQEHRTREAV